MLAAAIVRLANSHCDVKGIVRLLVDEAKKYYVALRSTEVENMQIIRIGFCSNEQNLVESAKRRNFLLYSCFTCREHLRHKRVIIG